MVDEFCRAAEFVPTPGGTPLHLEAGKGPFQRTVLKGFATFWEFSFYGQKKVADYEYHSLSAEKIHFHT